MNDGRVHIVEPDLDQSVAHAVSTGHLSAQLTPDTADVFIIAVCQLPFLTLSRAFLSPISVM